MRAPSRCFRARGLVTASVVGGALLQTTVAGAGGSLDANASPNVSVGAAPIRYEERRGLPTSIQTGFHGPDFAQVNVGISIDPVTSGGPLYVVEMPRGALVQASWGTDRRIVLRPVTGSDIDGLVTVRHTLTPAVDLRIAGFGLDTTFTFDATKLLNRLPGARFAYDSSGRQPFAPWGFSPVETRVTSPELDSAQLFALGMETLPELVSDHVTGRFGVRATTKPTFSYRTTRITMTGAGGAIEGPAGEAALPAVDGDFMDVIAAVEGEMTVRGEIAIRPFVHFDTIGSHRIAADLDIQAYSHEYTVPTTRVIFESAFVRIPMPNVRVPKQAVDVGFVRAGQQTTKRVSVENTGEKDAVMSFRSSSGVFRVPGERVTVPAKSRFALDVVFSADSASPERAEITVVSNDADSPEQTFVIGANGADLGDGASKPEGEDGCGCRTVRDRSSAPTWASAGLGALALATLARRRARKTRLSHDSSTDLEDI
jgi:MYXO-CTERM domain-containing protein